MAAAASTSPAASGRSITRAELARHNTPEDYWLAIDYDVYDLTKFLRFHPGGRHVLLEFAGKDATEAFYSLHRTEVLQKYQRFKIGRLADAPSDHKSTVELATPGAISKVPYAEPSAWQGWHSVYYTPEHLEFRKDVRKFLTETFAGNMPKWDDAGKPPPAAVWEKLGAEGILACRLGPGPHMRGRKLPGKLTAEKFDKFYEQIVHEEFATFGCPSASDGLGAGYVISAPAIGHFAKPHVARAVLPALLDGKKRSCLAISEAFAGSDVANIRTTATKTPDGKFYVVNGTKKWITNGTFSDYFVTAVRTGRPGMRGISLLLIERSEGLETQAMKTAYGGAAGTAYVTFDNVRVPVENLLGKENEGFKAIMANFNNERWLIIAGIIRGCSLVVEEAFKWANQRKVFGKPLISQPSIQEKLAHCIAQVESVRSWFDSITYQMTKMSFAEQTKKLSGPIGLCKLQSTRVAYFVSDAVSQILGGRAITKTGMGQIVERFARSIKYGAILGGSEEIMASLGVRQALKYFPPQAKM